MTNDARRGAVEEAARAHSRALWGICYRMTGDAADADDLVQETLKRALEHPGGWRDAPLDRWLAAVAVNLSRDRLRQRRRQHYPCPWLPAPVETDGEHAAPVSDVLPSHQTPAGRYELLESVSYAFLLALEALTPTQRAVLLLRDVFDYSVRETADCLSVSEANVKMTHLRARRAMESYDRSPRRPTPERRARTEQLLFELLRCLGQNDMAGAEAIVTGSVKTLNDGGGEFLAANVPVIGAKKVLQFYRRLNELHAPGRIEVRQINGQSAITATYLNPVARQAPHVVIVIDVDSNGLIDGIHTILATRKLHAIRWAGET